MAKKIFNGGTTAAYQRRIVFTLLFEPTGTLQMDDVENELTGQELGCI